MCKFVNNTKHSRIDRCMKPLIKYLKDNDYWVVACCCGHNKYPMTIIVKGMRNGIANYGELLSGINIPRTRNFYKKDKQGYYYIPEVYGANPTGMKEKQHYDCENPNQQTIN